MVAFMDESVVYAGKGSSRFVKILRSHFKTIIIPQVPFPLLQFSGYEIHNLLVELHIPTSDYSYPVVILIDAFVPKEGDITMH